MNSKKVIGGRFRFEYGKRAEIKHFQRRLDIDIKFKVLPGPKLVDWDIMAITKNALQRFCVSSLVILCEFF